MVPRAAVYGGGGRVFLFAVNGACPDRRFLHNVCLPYKDCSLLRRGCIAGAVGQVVGDRVFPGDVGIIAAFFDYNAAGDVAVDVVAARDAVQKVIRFADADDHFGRLNADGRARVVRSGAFKSGGGCSGGIVSDGRAAGKEQCEDDGYG